MADLDEAVSAVRLLLTALGADLGGDPELAGTPERVARAFRDELLSGYQRDPAALLRESLPTREDALVVVTGIQYVSVCPHHLMPCEGVAHVGYLPRGRIVGLGVIAQLVEALSRRLVLQETLGHQIVCHLAEHLGAAAAGVVLEAHHACLSARGERQTHARVVTHSFRGEWQANLTARAEFLGAVRASSNPRLAGT